MSSHELQIPCTITITIDAASEHEAITRARVLLAKALVDANAAAESMNIPVSIDAIDETTLPWGINGESMYVDSIS